MVGVRSLESEFLETNTHALYCSSTYNLTHSRKYHGLLIVPIGEERCVLLSHIEIIAETEQGSYQLTELTTKGTENRGATTMSSFEASPWPKIILAPNKDARLQLDITLMPEHPTLLISCKLVDETKALTLHLRPIFAYRNIHSLSQKNNYVNPSLNFHDHCTTVRPYDSMPELSFKLNQHNTFQPAFQWHNDVYYSIEEQRGYPCTEDLFSYGTFKVELTEKNTVHMAVSTQMATFNGFSHVTRVRKEKQRQFNEDKKNNAQYLTWSARHFIFQKTKKADILAGFPWFACWGRDSMIALPGLLLETQRFSIAKTVLKSYAQKLKDGLIPNTLDSQGNALSYNAIDATLWFAWAVSKYWEYSQDETFIYTHLWSALESIYQHLKKGTVYHSFCDREGLLHSGDSSTQLTWMDAKVGDQPVTPRYGYPIEVNALWYHLLSFLALLAPRFDKSYDELFDDIKKFREHFEQRFWLEQEGFFADCLFPIHDKKKASLKLRPNQCIAMALVPVDEKKAKKALELVTNHLWTPFGLRTLAPSDPLYKARYEGDQETRDNAYHNGTVWPWLLGFYTEAVKKYQPLYLSNAKQSIQRLETIATKQQSGLLPEIFDAAEPHHPRGSIHQAWSVAELIRSNTLVKS
ncbi:MAG: amylo-alpha-1,6-glucosidase [bacterium]